MFKKIIRPVVLVIAGIVALLYFTGNGFVFLLVGKVLETGRTTAGINDYLYFDNIEIPPSDNPQAWLLDDDYNIIPSPPSLDALHKELGTVAFLIIKNDSLWHERYFDDYGLDSKSNSFSMIKTIVAAALHKAIEAGDVDSEDQKVIDFLPWLTGDYAKDVSMGDLASMSSGLKWKEDYENLLTITPRTYVEKDMARLMKTIPIESEPGQQFVYQSGNTQLLAMALQKATGKSISVLLHYYFWNPMGVEQPTSWIIDSKTHGLEKAYCCWNANARDFARFGKLFKNHGVWNGEQLIDSTFTAKAVRPRFEDSPQYGYGWWLGDVDGKAFFSMRGHLGQYVIVIPEHDVILVRLGHHSMDNLPESDTPADLPLFVREALRMLAIDNEA
jgi:CubicO group peptidase (beta-lactamase class C family)